MRLIRDDTASRYRIRSYEPEEPPSIVIGERRLAGSVRLTPAWLDGEVGLQRLAELTFADLRPLLEQQPELILIGTGTRFALPERALLRQIIGGGVGCEAMATAAACRTFNLLANEGRHVGALLLLRT
ncbi:hypothetical protein CKO15_06825 [Halorhodospira abdelmalekii]|uniref:Mth938-like domain-containing protein n=1 Tax=Halorhodospira abdelmalekii TaxID=421629 RepID=UPI001904B749|nr:MTH938/NDUFAF3 family protein [Halorhodospira abdelmalekii]MBK1735001.1 hypothetical protein [Halorhodospira abdelmalekii]